MSATDDRQRKVTSDALAALNDTDFALAGSGAIREHGISNRPTQDVDLFTSSTDPELFSQAVAGLTATLTASGHTVETLRRAPAFARLQIRTPDGGDVEMDLAVDWRRWGPERKGIGPVLSLEDAVGSKIGALYSRAETRDFLDADAIRRSGRFTDDELLRIAAERDPGFDRTIFAQQLLLVGQLSVTETRRYEVSAEELNGVQQRLEDWARTLLAEHAGGPTS